MIDHPPRKFSISAMLEYSSGCRRYATFVLIVLAGSGCGSSGPGIGELKGKVTYRSQPVTEGNVVCENRIQGLIQVSKLGPDGEYYFKELMATDYLISIQPPDVQGMDENSDFDGSTRMPRLNLADPKNIPLRVRSTQTTPLMKSVKAGENRFDIELADLP